MRTILLIVFCFCSNTIFCQFKEIDKKNIYSSKTKAFYTFEGALLVDGQGTAETDALHLFITKAKLNRQTCELILEGRVCEKVDTNNNCNIGSSNTLIFSGTKKKGTVADTINIAKTSADRKDYKNEGFFKITVKLQETRFLYFYDSFYYVEEFSMKNIMRSLKLIK
jgi:hypothetical protein